MNDKKTIIDELDSRIERLNKHYSDEKNTENNPQHEMYAAQSKLINSAIENELRSIKEFTEQNISD